ncbi:hypothetical protein X975_13705, partial [Stegodyphus mimosarum]
MKNLFICQYQHHNKCKLQWYMFRANTFKITNKLLVNISKKN